MLTFFFLYSGCGLGETSGPILNLKKCYKMLHSLIQYINLKHTLMSLQLCYLQLCSDHHCAHLKHQTSQQAHI